MKKRIQNTMKKHQWLSICLLILLLTPMLLMFPVHFLGASLAFVAAIGEVEVEGVEEKAAAQFQKAMESIAQKAVKGYISDTRMNELLTKEFADYTEKMKGTNDELSVKLEAALKDLESVGLELKSIKEKGTGNVTYKSIKQQIIESLGGKSKEDIIKAMRGNMAIDIDLEKTKIVGTVTVSNTFPLAQVDTEWAYQPLNPPIVRQFANVGSTALGRYGYVSTGAREGGAARTAAGSAKTQSDATPVVLYKDPDKITSYWDFHEEALDDIPNFAAEMQREITDQINAQEDAYFILGSTNIVGLNTCPAFSTTGIVVDTPGVADEIMSAATQIAKNNFKANLALMNPVDYANFVMGKDTVGAYLIPPFVSQDGTKIGAVTVQQDANIPAGYVLVGDMTKYIIRDYKVLTLRFGYDGNNFKANIITCVGEKRVIAFFKTDHQNAFVYDKLSDIYTAIGGS